jgi:hypothetical protein
MKHNEASYIPELDPGSGMGELVLSQCNRSNYTSQLMPRVVTGDWTYKEGTAAKLSS